MGGARERQRGGAPRHAGRQQGEHALRRGLVLPVLAWDSVAGILIITELSRSHQSVQDHPTTCAIGQSVHLLGVWRGGFMAKRDAIYLSF